MREVSKLFGDKIQIELIVAETSRLEFRSKQDREESEDDQTTEAEVLSAALMSHSRAVYDKTSSLFISPRSSPINISIRRLGIRDFLYSHRIGIFYSSHTSDLDYLVLVLLGLDLFLLALISGFLWNKRWMIIQLGVYRFFIGT